MSATPLKIQILVDDNGSVKIRQFGVEAENAASKGSSAFKRTGKTLDEMNVRAIKAANAVFSIQSALAALATGAAIAGLLELVNTASDLEETASKFTVVFEGQIDEAQKWAKNLVDSYFMSRREARLYLSSVQDLLVPMGMQAAAAGILSNEIVKLSADLGSFNNQKTAVVMDDIQSALVGNYETMKKYGVVLNASLVQEKALAMGLANTKDALTAADKAQAAYALIVAGSTAAIGDMARTSGSAANQTKKLHANEEDIKAFIGNQLLPAYTSIVTKINEWIKANESLIQQEIQETFETIESSLRGIVSVYDALPDGVVGAAGVGIVGRILTGSTPIGQAAAMLTVLNAQLKSIGSGMNLGAIPEKSASLWENLKNIFEAIGSEWDNLKISLSDPESFEQAYQALKRIFEYDPSKTRNVADAILDVDESLIGVLPKLTVTAMRLEDMGDSAELTYADLMHLDQAILEIEKRRFNQVAASLFGFHDAALAVAQSMQQIDYDQAIEQQEASKILLEDINTALSENAELFENSIFGDAASQNLQNVAETLGKLSEMYAGIAQNEKNIAEWRKQANLIEDTEERTKALQKVKDLEIKYADEAITAQLSGYRQLFSTTSQLFDENSSGRQAFHAAEMAFTAAEIAIGMQKALVNAVASVTSAGQGDPYTAIARVAAMAIMMGAALANIGETFSFSGGSGSGFSGSKTILGDTSGSWETNSIADAWALLEEYDVKQYETLLDIYYEMRDLNQNITALVTGVAKGVAGFELDSSNFATTSSEYDMPELPGWNSLPLMDNAVGQLLSGFVDFIADELLSWVFGGGQRIELLGAGLAHRKIQSMAELLGGDTLALQGYGYFERITEGGMFSDDDHDRFVEYVDLSNQSLKLFADVVRSIGTSMISLAKGLGYGEEKIQEIYDYAVKLGSIDLEGMSNQEIEDALNQWFSDFADQMAGDLFGDLILKYQKVDEGLYETAVRLVVEKEIVLEVLSMTGQAFSGTAREAVEFSQILIDMAGDLESLTEAAQTYFDEYLTDAEKQAWLTNNLVKAYASLEIVLPATRDQFKELMGSIDQTTDEGMALYLALLDLADATDVYYDALEAANQKITDAQRELTGTTDQGTISDISGRYGWTINEDTAFDFIKKFISMTAEEIEAYAALKNVTTEQLVDDIMSLAEIFGWAGDAAAQAANDFASLRDSIESTLSGISGSFGGGNSAAMLMSQITGMQSIPMSEMTGDTLLSMSEKLVQWYNAAASELQAAARSEANVARLFEQVADRVGSLVSQIDGTIRSIKTSGLNVALPGQKAADMAVDYEAAYAAAQAGGTAEIQEYLSVAQTYLGAYQAVHKSDEYYQAEYARVLGQMEEIKAKAEAGGYDEQILSELKSGHETIDVDLTAIQAEFSNIEGWILNALSTLENLDMIIHIDWANWDGDQIEALRMLQALIEVYGPSHEYTLKFLAELPLDIFENVNELATAAGWIADNMGGWNSTAEITFLKNVAANWQFENIGEILTSIGYVATASGGYGTTATVSFVAELMDRYGQTLADMPTWYAQMGLSDAETFDISVAVAASVASLNMYDDTGALKTPAQMIDWIMSEVAPYYPAEVTKAVGIQVLGDLLTLSMPSNVDTPFEMYAWLSSQLSGLVPDDIQDTIIANILTTSLTNTMPSNLNTLAEVSSWLTTSLRGVVPDSVADQTMARITMNLVAAGTIGMDSIAEIEAYVNSLGIMDANISRTLKINLVYEMVSTGALNLAEVAKYVYNQAYAAWLMSPGVSAAKALLNEMQGLAGMWNVRDAWNLGANVNAFGGYSSNIESWADLWTKHGLPAYGWEYGGIAAGPEDGWWARLHGTELVVSQKADYPATVLSNGGSTQAGANRGEEIALLRELVDLQKEEIDTLRAKDTNPRVNVSVDAQGIIREAGRYVSEKSRRGTLDVRTR